MDAYDAQMAALRSSAAAPSGGDDDGKDSPAAPNGDPSPSGPASAGHWSGQNSYMTHLSPSVNGYKAPSYGRFPSCNSHGGDEQRQDSSGSSLSADDAASYQSYLQRLQSDMDAERADCDAVNNASGDGLDVDKVASQMLDSSRRAVAAESTTNIAAAFREEAEEKKAPPTEDEMLAMISNEVAYTKFRGRNPNSLLDLEFDVLRQRVLDNIEDATQKKNGKSKGKSYLSGKDVPREERKTVVILGTGWGSHAFVKLASTYDLRIVVVSPVNHFVFTPMLASAAVGTVEYRSMTEPIRVTNPNIDNFVEGRAIGVNVLEKTVQVQLTKLETATNAFTGMAANAGGRLDPDPVESMVVYGEDGSVLRDPSQGAGTVIDLSYDHLVCAVGTSSRLSLVKGAADYCFPLKTSQDSKRLRTAIGESLEYASRPDVQEYYYEDDEMQHQASEERRRRVHIAIVGGGPTGVELAGELMDFFQQVCGSPDGAYKHLRDDVSVTLIQSGTELVPAMDKELRARARQSLEEQGVRVIFNTRLQEVGQDYVVVKEKGSGAEETIPVGLTVWAAGNAPVPFVKELLSQLPPEATGSAGRVNVDDWLRCPTPTPETFGSILVLGDVACLNGRDKYKPEPEPLPQTAQVAGQQGSFAARLLNRGYEMDATPPRLPELSSGEAFSLLRTWLVARGLEEAQGFRFLSLGLLAYIGQEEALNQVMLGNVPLFNYSGKVAFALWRTVYLSKQASTRNQALIAFDWLRTEAFGRDITRL